MNRGRAPVGPVRQVRMTQAMWDELHRLAVLQGVPIAEVIRVACDEHITRSRGEAA